MPKLSYRLRHNPIRQFIDRGRYGFSPDDCWNLESYLSDVIARSVSQFAQDTNGYPSTVESFEEWEAVLAEIVEGFQLYAEPDDDMGYVDGKFSVEAYTKEERRRTQKLNRSFDLLKKYYQGLWW